MLEREVCPKDLVWWNPVMPSTHHVTCSRGEMTMAFWRQGDQVPRSPCVTPFLLWSTLLGWWLCSLGSKFRYNSFYGDTNMAKVFERGEKIACAIKWSWDGKSPVSQATPCSVSLPVKWRSLLDCDAVTVTSSGVRCHTLVPVLGAWPGGGKIINTQGTHIFWQQYNITY